MRLASQSGVVLNAANYSNVTDPVSGEPLALDLTDAAALDRVYAAADRLLQTYPTVDALQAVEAALLERQRELPTMIHLAVKLAKSKALMAVCPPVFVTMITAMYNEKNRMCSKDEHPNGENFLVNKSREMEWLFEAAPQSGYELIYVDDGMRCGGQRASAGVQCPFGHRLDAPQPPVLNTMLNVVALVPL